MQSSSSPNPEILGLCTGGLHIQLVSLSITLESLQLSPCTTHTVKTGSPHIPALHVTSILQHSHNNIIDGDDQKIVSNV